MKPDLSCDSIAGESPRLVVIGDVPVERTAGGMLLLYRLLIDYPPERLMVVASAGLSSGRPADRLPSVCHEDFAYDIPRVIRMRRNPAWATLAARYVTWKNQRRLVDLVAGFQPQAILSVSHGFLWFAAAAAARRLGVPFHLILHDDWASWQAADCLNPAVRRMTALICRRAMQPIYRSARSRLCVSPGMEELYMRLFGVRGQVLYPTRGDDSPPACVRVRPEASGPPVIAYCGAVHLGEGRGSRVEILRKTAAVVGEFGGHLDLYTLTQREHLEGHGLRPPVVRFPGFLSPTELAKRLGQTAHALLLNGSFAPSERDEVTTLFPSKLADYTAIGLPVLVWAPRYSSAARWAAENPDAAILISSEDPSTVRSAVERLVADRDYAARLAASAVEAGNRDFDPVTARRMLLSCLSRAVAMS